MAQIGVVTCHLLQINSVLLYCERFEDMDETIIVSSISHIWVFTMQMSRVSAFIYGWIRDSSLVTLICLSHYDSDHTRGSDLICRWNLMNNTAWVLWLWKRSSCLGIECSWVQFNLKWFLGYWNWKLIWFIFLLV